MKIKFKERKKVIILSCILSLVIVFVSFCLCFAEVKIPLNRYPPIIEKVNISPENPTTTEEVQIKAKIYNDPQKTEAEVFEANLYYSNDNSKSWEKIEMEQDEEDKTLWTAKIPPQKEGKIIFYISAKDSAGSISTELPLKMELTEKDFFNDEQTNRMVLFLEDEEEKDVPGDMDIKEGWIGYDDENIYVKILFKGKVIGGLIGRLFPFYGLFFIDDKDEELWDKSEQGIWCNGYLTAYSDHSFYISLGGGSEFQLIEWERTARGGCRPKGSSIKGMKKENQIYFIFKNPYKKGSLKILKTIMTSYQTEALPAWWSMDYVDISPFSYIYFRDNYFEVKERK